MACTLDCFTWATPRVQLTTRGAQCTCFCRRHARADAPLGITHPTLELSACLIARQPVYDPNGPAHSPMGYVGPTHADATSLTLLHRDVLAQTPLAHLAQELRRQPMSSTGPFDHFNPLHYDTTHCPFALPVKVLCLARIQPTTSEPLRSGCAGAGDQSAMGCPPPAALQRLSPCMSHQHYCAITDHSKQAHDQASLGR
jgi:hypothetical protein